MSRRPTRLTSAALCAGVVLALFCAPATAAEAFVAGLEQRLRAEGVEGVNAHLLAQPTGMAELNQRTSDCEPQAVDLSVRLSRTKVTKATAFHKEALRIAVGTCTEFVLSLLSQKEVPGICAAASSWTVSQTARELKRRIRQIDADEQQRPVQHAQACRAAYLYELQNTRVGVQVGPPRK